MSADGTLWKATLGVRADDGDGPMMVSPILGLNPNVSTPASIIDSVDAVNLGYVIAPIRFAFNMLVQGVRIVDADRVIAEHNNVARLFQMQLNRKLFSIAAYEQTGPDGLLKSWVFKQIVFDRCIIMNSNAPQVPAPGVIPMITFSCAALKLNVTPYEEDVWTGFDEEGESWPKEGLL